ncbi:aromatic ring-hydroxylating oxygenase subunit alpha [Aquimarina agarivorans]|uniref:aromatic ring-hydroxylating oxygenase subunit alpha n=1 Tax=Aquimarina agarivorans TaxID=980584 RepID=UPI000248F309|nr:aromatic ring-hydroxylating dioxygenase subunit alpha [Aquimarina agarivorans]
MNNFNQHVAEGNTTKTLSGSAYTDPEVFEKERRFLFRTLPVMAVPSCHLEKKGSYTVTDIAKESIITVRGKDGTIRALANSCRHRGKRLLQGNNLGGTEKISNLKSIVCPYHGWNYKLDGALAHARGDEAGLLKGLCLRKLQVHEAGGLTFYNKTNENVLHLNALDKALGLLCLSEGKVSATKQYDVKANWKLWTENFLECWHCASSHPELSENKGFITQFENGNEDVYVSDDIKWRIQAQKKGWITPEDADLEMDKAMFSFNVSLPLGKGNLTASKNGKRLGPAFNGAAGFEGGAIFGCLGPFLFYMAYVDYVILFCVRPIAVEQTKVDVFWITAKDFEGSTEDLTWLWNTTLKQDIKLVEESQQGVSSLYYTPGPFQADEYRTQAFVEWWKNWFHK